MGRRTRRWWNIIGRIWDAFADFVGERVPTESSLRSDVGQMLEGIDLRADATSYAMALADQKRKELAAEVKNYESLNRQAEEFLAANNELKARRCMALALQSKKLIEGLKNEYSALQADAEARVKNFRDKQQEVDRKAKELPKLEQETALVRAQEKIQKLEGQFDLEGAERSFERAASEIQLKKQQFQNRAILTADPNAGLDKEIRETLGEREIEEAMNALRKKISQKDEMIEAEVIEDPVSEARNLLEEPRYAGLLSGSILITEQFTAGADDFKAREKILIKRRGD